MADKEKENGLFRSRNAFNTGLCLQLKEISSFRSDDRLHSKRILHLVVISVFGRISFQKAKLWWERTKNSHCSEVCRNALNTGLHANQRMLLAMMRWPANLTRNSFGSWLLFLSNYQGKTSILGKSSVERRREFLIFRSGNAFDIECYAGNPAMNDPHHDHMANFTSNS